MVNGARPYFRRAREFSCFGEMQEMNIWKISLRPVSTVALRPCRKNWIELDLGASLAWRLFQTFFSYHPTLTLCVRKSSLPVSGALNENMADRHWVRHEWSLTEARRLNHVALLNRVSTTTSVVLHDAGSTLFQTSNFNLIVLSSNLTDQLSLTRH